MTDTTLEGLIGPGAMHRYEMATEDEQRRIRAWAQQLPNLTDRAFRDLCINAVTAGALSESQRQTAEEPYVKASACIFEAKRRYRAVGHADSCEGDDLYREGYNEAGRRFGLSVGEPRTCTCGHEEG